MFDKEGSHSGLVRSLGKRLGEKSPQEFESLTLRLRLAVARLRRDAVRRRRVKAGRINNMHYVYSLKCKDGFYVGCTDNLKDRIDRHQKGQVPATVNRLPVNLEFYLAINDKYKAFQFEKYLKSGSGRAFINKHLVSK